MASASFTASKNSGHETWPRGFGGRFQTVWFQARFQRPTRPKVVFGGLLARVRVLVAKLPRARARIGPRRLPAGRAHQAVIRNGFENNQPKSKAARSSASLTARLATQRGAVICFHPRTTEKPAFDFSGCEIKQPCSPRTLGVRTWLRTNTKRRGFGPPLPLPGH